MADRFKPTQKMASNAKKGLELRDKFNHGGTDVGVHRAEQLVRQDRAGRHAEFRQVGVQRLQPEWFLATIELAAGLALLVVAAGLAIHAVRQVRTLSTSHQPASVTVAS